MPDLPTKDQFLQSLERCTQDEAFIPTFYERFLAASDEIRHKFRNTDFEQQNLMLLQSLRLSAGAIEGHPESLRELRDRAETHNRHNLNISPRLYDVWLETVVGTARDFDDAWTDDVEHAWRTILGHVVKQMIRYY